MTLNLRDHFDRAVSDDPGAALEEIADAAIAEGGRLRRRRQRTAAGVAAGAVALIVAVAGLNLSSNAPESADPSETIAAAMMPVTAPSCLPHPVEVDVTDVVVFLAAASTDEQRSALAAALHDDPWVDALMFESREQAYQRFRSRWAKNPDLLAAVHAEQFPQSFRLRLVAAGQYPAFRSQYAAMEGVEQVIGRKCAKDAPVGGVL